MNNKFKALYTLGVFFFTGLMFLTSGCGNRTRSAVTGTVKIDGSSTVFPITEAVAEEFGKLNPDVRVTVGISGTGGGFKKFCLGEIDINDASRPIKSGELEKADKNNINFIEIPVAYDGISIVINPANDWVDYLTVEELTKIWKPGSHVNYWDDVRDDWPHLKIKLYGPGTDSGTFDYFTEAINGKSQRCRPDFTKSEDDNILVQGVAGDKSALGFFGYAYYKENMDKLNVVPVDAGNGPVIPNEDTINDGSYSPLSRPIFIYVNSESAGRSAIESFTRFYIQNAGALSSEVGYVALPDQIYSQGLEKFSNRVTGKWFSK